MDPYTPLPNVRHVATAFASNSSSAALSSPEALAPVLLPSRARPESQVYEFRQQIPIGQACQARMKVPRRRLRGQTFAANILSLAVLWVALGDFETVDVASSAVPLLAPKRRKKRTNNGASISRLIGNSGCEPTGPWESSCPSTSIVLTAWSTPGRPLTRLFPNGKPSGR